MNANSIQTISNIANILFAFALSPVIGLVVALIVIGYADRNRCLVEYLPKDTAQAFKTALKSPYLALWHDFAGSNKK